MATELFANNFAAQLASGIANTDTTITLTSSVPTALQTATGQWRAIIQDSFGTEYIIVPGGQAGPTLTGVLRGQEGSTATSHSQGAFVTHVVTAGAIAANQLPQITLPAPTGVAATDTANLQTAINLAIVGTPTDSRTAPMTQQAAKARVVAQAGTYNLNATIKVYAVQGLIFEGAGPLATTFTSDGTTIGSLFDFNGCTQCDVGDFRVSPGVNVTTALNIDAVSTVSLGTGSYDKWHDLRIDGNWANGLQYGASGTTNGQDLYHHEFDHVVVFGGQTAGSWSNGTLWQAGVTLGLSGATPSNVLHPRFTDTNVFGCINGVQQNGVGVNWDGGCLQENAVDIDLTALHPTDPIDYGNYRSENSGRLITTANSGTPGLIRLHDIAWTSPNLNADNIVIRNNLGGHFKMDNVVCIGTNVNMAVNLGSSSHPQFADIRGLNLIRSDANPDPKVWVTVAAGSFWTARDITVMTTSNSIITGSLKGPVSNADRTTATTTYTALPSDKIIGTNSSGGAFTITLPQSTTVSAGHQVLIKDEGNIAATDNVTVAAGSGDTIEGAATSVISTNRGFLRLYLAGATWEKI